MLGGAEVARRRARRRASADGRVAREILAPRVERGLIPARRRMARARFGGKDQRRARDSCLPLVTPTGRAPPCRPPLPAGPWKQVLLPSWKLFTAGCSARLLAASLSTARLLCNSKVSPLLPSTALLYMLVQLFCSASIYIP